MQPMKPLVVATCLAVFSPMAIAGLPVISPTQMPEGGSVIAYNSGTEVDGSSSPNLSSVANGSTIVLSNSNNNNAYAVIRWSNGFDLGAKAQIAFSSSGTYTNGYVLNIDGSGNPSQIDGTLNAAANTAVFVANGNGVIVGGNAVINAPGGIALLGESMNNTTAVADFVGNNGSGTDYLDFGSIYPGPVTIDAGANINAGTGGVLLAGSSIVNSGSIVSSEINVFAGWAPSKTSATVNGVPSTPVYRLGNVQGLLSSSPNNMGNQGLSIIPQSSQPYTFTNAGAITANQKNSANQVTIFSEGGAAIYGVVTASDANVSSNYSYQDDNTGVDIVNSVNDVNVYGTVSVTGSRSHSYLSSLPGNSFVTNNVDYRYPSSISIGSGNGNVGFGQYGKIEGANVYLLGNSVLGYYEADNVLANDLFFDVYSKINGAAGNPTPTNFLGNGFGIAPFTSGATVNLSVTGEAAGVHHVNYVNIAVNGSANLSSGQTRSFLGGFLADESYNNQFNDYMGVNSSGSYTAPPSGLSGGSGSSSAVKGGSMLVQASGQLTIVPPNNTYLNNQNNNSQSGTSGNNYDNGGAFVFPGGLVLIGNDGLTVNVPLINGWSLSATPFQGVFLQGSQIDFNNNAYVVTGQGQFVNFSTQPGSLPPILQFVYGNTILSPSAYNSSFGSGAFLNSYSSILAGVLQGKSLASLVNTTPM